MNVTNTTVINNTNVTNVYNNHVQNGSVPTANYANRAVPGAVVAVPQNAFASARPVQQVATRVSPAQLTAMRPAAAAPPVSPQVMLFARVKAQPAPQLLEPCAEGSASHPLCGDEPLPNE